MRWLDTDQVSHMVKMSTQAKWWDDWTVTKSATWIKCQPTLSDEMIRQWPSQPQAPWIIELVAMYKSVEIGETAGVWWEPREKGKRRKKEKKKQRTVPQCKEEKTEKIMGWWLFISSHSSEANAQTLQLNLVGPG